MQPFKSAMEEENNLLQAQFGIDSQITNEQMSCGKKSSLMI